MHSGRKRCMAWSSKQFFANEAAFGPNEQIVDQGRVGFGDASQLDPIDFQGPVRVGGPLLPTLPFARLVVQIFTLEGFFLKSRLHFVLKASHLSRIVLWGHVNVRSFSGNFLTRYE